MLRLEGRLVRVDSRDGVVLRRVAHELRSVEFHRPSVSHRGTHKHHPKKEDAPRDADGAQTRLEREHAELGLARSLRRPFELVRRRPSRRVAHHLDPDRGGEASEAAVRMLLLLLWDGCGRLDWRRWWWWRCEGRVEDGEKGGGRGDGRG